MGSVDEEDEVVFFAFGTPSIPVPIKHKHI
jgi:hypothetical protein